MSEQTTTYRVTYERVGPKGGRNGNAPPPPLTIEAVSATYRGARVTVWAHITEDGGLS